MNADEQVTGSVASPEAAAGSAHGSPARPSMKELQRQLRQDCILDAAVDLLKKKGYDAMTLEDITEAIGISRPTLYQHFRSKEDVVVNVCLRCRVQLSGFIAAQDASRPAKDRLTEFIDYALDLRFGTQGIAFGDVMKVISSYEDKDPDLVETETKLIAAYVGLVEAAQKEGAVRTDMGAHMLSQVLGGLIKNYTLDESLAKGDITIADIKAAAKQLLLPPA